MATFLCSDIWSILSVVIAVIAGLNVTLWCEFLINNETFVKLQVCCKWLKIEEMKGNVCNEKGSRKLCKSNQHATFIKFLKQLLKFQVFRS